MTTDFLQAQVDIRGDKFKEAAMEMNYVKWLPYLGLNRPHPLSGEDSKEIQEAKEVFEFFKNEFPGRAFSKFLGVLNTLPVLMNGERVSQVVKYVRLARLAKSHKEQFKKFQTQLEGMRKK
jgi:hypothetical protein